MSADPMKVALLQSKLSRMRVASVMGLGLIVAFFACGIAWLYQLVDASRSAKSSVEARAEQLVSSIKRTEARLDEQIGVLQFRLTNSELEGAGLVDELRQLRQQLGSNVAARESSLTVVPQIESPPLPDELPPLVPEPEFREPAIPVVVAPARSEWKPTAHVVTLKRRPPAPPLPEWATEAGNPFLALATETKPELVPAEPLPMAIRFAPPPPPLPEDAFTWRAILPRRPPAPPVPEWVTNPFSTLQQAKRLSD